MKRILFVDDESRILDGIRRMLYADRKRWEMEFAVGGEAALKACEGGPFDVVVSDMRMPMMDGAALLAHIRDRYPSTARIVLSGYSELEAATRTIPVAHRFLSKPCNPTDLQATLERVFTLQDLLSSAEIRRVVGAVGELPSLSTTYVSLTQALGNPNTNIGTVADIVGSDIAMSAKVLQLVNSAFFGLAQTVTSLHTAVSYLGMETIKNLVLVADTFSVFAPDSRIPQSVCESLQQGAHCAATIASKLPVDKKWRDVTIVAALLRDVGRLVLASKMPDRFLAALALASERSCEPFEAEEELLGTSHAEIGAYLLGLWGIPHMAVEAIAHHHRPTRIPHSGFDSAAAVYVAHLLTHELDALKTSTSGSAHPVEGKSTSELKEYDRDCLEKLGIWQQYPEFRVLAREALGEKKTPAMPGVRS